MADCKAGSSSKRFFRGGMEGISGKKTVRLTVRQIGMQGLFQQEEISLFLLQEIALLYIIDL